MFPTNVRSLRISFVLKCFNISIVLFTRTFSLSMYEQIFQPFYFYFFRLLHFEINFDLFSFFSFAKRIQQVPVANISPLVKPPPVNTKHETSCSCEVYAIEQLVRQSYSTYSRSSSKKETISGYERVTQYLRAKQME